MQYPERAARLASVLALLAACGGKSATQPDAHGGGPDGLVEDASIDAASDAATDAPSDAGMACVFQAPPGQFNPDVECAWNAPAASTAYPAFDDVVSTPVVINLTDDDSDSDVDLDDVPDIAFVAYPLETAGCPTGATCGCCNSSGVLRVVSGGCASGTLPQHFVIGAAEIEADTGVAGVWLDSSGGLAAGDIDSDGSVDLVATTQNGGTIAFERNGDVKWYQPAYPSRTDADHLAGTQPAIADLDADGQPEIIQGRVVLRGSNGTLKWRGTGGVGTNGFMGPVSVAGDIDLDGTLEVLSGGTMYRADGTVAWSYEYATPISTTNCQATGFPCDGFTATGNFDADNEGEIVVVRAGVIYILNHDGTSLMVGGAPVQIALPVIDCARNEGGPPTVADFDGDGKAEIGVAGADYYIVVDLECLATPLPAACAASGVRWSVANADCSSRVTGSSVFDFEGDGRAEVIYADETAFRVLDGIDGQVRLNIPNTSHTRLEMPIVADVDNDGNAEVVYIENGAEHGIRVLGDTTDTWVSTRRIWNQHSYHVTNVSELGAIPMGEPANWLAPSTSTVAGVMNNFRQNLPAANAFAAPDLRVTLAVDANACSLVASVCNEGDIQVGAGVPVHFYDNTTMMEIACQGGTPTTPQSLNPGACAPVSCAWPMPAPNGAVNVRACVDNDGYACSSGAAGGNNECVENNNLADATATQGCIQVL